MPGGREATHDRTTDKESGKAGKALRGKGLEIKPCKPRGSKMQSAKRQDGIEIALLEVKAAKRI